MKRPSSVPWAIGVLVLLLLPGCADPFPGEGRRDGTTYAQLGFTGSDPNGTDPDAWPDVGGTLRILDHGVFASFDVAARQFHNLTGVRVAREDFGSTADSLNVAIREKGDPSFDLFYGIDNVLLARAEDEGILLAYRPMLGQRVSADIPPMGGFPDAAEWSATPVDQGYIAVNWDREASLEERPIEDLSDVLANAGDFVAVDPRYDTPGLGFLLATIATFGEEGEHDWRDYWADLFDGGVLVVPSWTIAYEQHFSAGYGAEFGGRADKALVTSYTESPAYEAYFGRPADRIAGVVLAEDAVFHQVQTMAILDGTRNLAAAQAWVEFTLTDYFQALAAPNGVYPVVADLDVSATYGGLDPRPCAGEASEDCFVPADLDYAYVGDNLDRWLDEWTTLCEAHDCA
jgi:thiamine transport system substrate-binding protein